MRDVPYYELATGVDEHRLKIPKLNRTATGETWHSAVIEDLFAESREWMLARLDALTVPAIKIDFGFPSNADIKSVGRLPLFAILIADRVKELTGTQFASVKLSKRQAQNTTLHIGEAIPSRPAGAIVTAMVSTRRSYATSRFASEIHDAVGGIRDVYRPQDPLFLNLSYVTGLPRTWSRLWLPTISGIFSTESAEGTFSEAQIVKLGLDHLSVGEQLGHGVIIAASLYPPGSAA